MKPFEVKNYYSSLYNFNKKTTMSCASLSNWIKWGYIPFCSQKRIELLTEGKLKALWEDSLK